MRTVTGEYLPVGSVDAGACDVGLGRQRRKCLLGRLWVIEIQGAGGVVADDLCQGGEVADHPRPKREDFVCGKPRTGHEQTDCRNGHGDNHELALDGCVPKEVHGLMHFPPHDVGQGQ